jgi:hypothetical protein
MRKCPPPFPLGALLNLTWGRGVCSGCSWPKPETWTVNFLNIGLVSFRILLESGEDFFIFQRVKEASERVLDFVEVSTLITL